MKGWCRQTQPRQLQNFCKTHNKPGQRYHIFNIFGFNFSAANIIVIYGNTNKCYTQFAVFNENFIFFTEDSLRTL